MKKILLIIFLFNFMSWAQIFMNIKNKDGTTHSYDIQEVRKLTFSDVVSVQDQKLISSAINSFTLLQNYPNPFNPTTTFEYQIPESGYVEMFIYDISGKLVKTIERNFKNAGTYKITWDSKNDFGQMVTSGVYLFQLKYDNSLLIKKIVLIK